MSTFEDNTAEVIVAVCKVAAPLAQAAVIVARGWCSRRRLSVGPRGPDQSRPSPKAERLSGKRRAPGDDGPRR